MVKVMAGFFRITGYRHPFTSTISTAKKFPAFREGVRKHKLLTGCSLLKWLSITTKMAISHDQNAFQPRRTKPIARLSEHPCAPMKSQREADGRSRCDLLAVVVPDKLCRSLRLPCRLILRFKRRSCLKVPASNDLYVSPSPAPDGNLFSCPKPSVAFALFEPKKSDNFPLLT
ncbi:MAG: hypothetical protein HZLCBSQH_000981 [Candidatus Fervidibacterota bacterium]